MSDLRGKVIDSLNSNEDGSLNFFNSIASLEKEEGEQVYNILLNVLTQLEFSLEDAKKN